MTANRTRIIWLLLFGWAILAVIAVWWGVPNAEDDLTARAETALQQAGIAASVDFDGRDARLSGPLPEADRVRALDVVQGLTGVREAAWEVPEAAATTSTTVTATTVAAPTTTAPPGSSSTTTSPDTSDTTVAENPSTLTAALSRGALTLSGVVPDAEVVARVSGIADLIYGPFVTNNLVVDDSVGAAPWLSNAPNLMAFLPIVGEAELSVVGTKATLTGTAGSDTKKAQLEGALADALGPDVRLLSSIEVTNLSPPVYLAQAPGDGTVTISGTMPDQEAIDLIGRAAIDAYGEDNVINDLAIEPGIDTTFSIFRIPLTFAQFRPIPEWELRIENDIISGNVRGGATFDFGSAELTPALRTLLDTGAGILLRNPSILMTIEGHTDSVGSDAFNLALSNARAQAGVDYLVALGVQPGRLFAVGYGETRSIASNETAEGRRENRRLEFVLGPPS